MLLRQPLYCLFMMQYTTRTFRRYLQLYLSSTFSFPIRIKLIKVTQEEAWPRKEPSAATPAQMPFAPFSKLWDGEYNWDQYNVKDKAILNRIIRISTPMYTNVKNHLNQQNLFFKDQIGPSTSLPCVNNDKNTAQGQ